MPEHEIRFTKETLKDLKKHSPRLKIKLKEILKILSPSTHIQGKTLSVTSVDSIPST